ncbi:SAM-dependent DNA methyltransferase [Candidatus Kaiserbacteria bacterium]|nr:SAM-dependent DNA methyltransferase [Candidatus Kaiserbacteria bacterium]
MAKEKKQRKTEKNGDENFEAQLFKAADKLRKNIDAGEYKHIVLGLIFLKYISDAFEDHYKKLKEGKGKYKGADPEDKDEYKAENVFWTPPEARWTYLHSRAKLPSIGKDLDAAMEVIEKENPTLKGILTKDYAKPNLDKIALGELVDLISNIALGKETDKSKDIIGRVYEYFLGEFASLEGKKGGQFYTPRSIVELMVGMTEPLKGRVFDPACGSGGMFVSSERFVEAHQGRVADISIYGQESNHTTYRLCRMNLALRGIDGSQVSWNSEGSFLKDAHPDLKADYILANPPFNQSDWGHDILRNDVRWKYGVPPEGNANYAWLQHMVHHLAPKGVMATVLSNGSLSVGGVEGEMRKKLVDDDLVDCIVALPKQLFYNTGIPACLWFISRKRLGNGDRKRTGEILFIDASEKGFMADRTHREFTQEDIQEIANTYHEWRKEGGKYEDIKGFCKSASLEEVEKNNYALTAGRYVGIADEEDDGEPFEDKMKRLTETLKEQMSEEEELNKEIKKQLKRVGFDI